MRVLLVSDSSLGLPGGVQTYTRNLALALQERGHEVAMLSCGQQVAHQDFSVVPGLQLRVPFNGAVASVAYCRDDSRLDAFVERFSPDIVHTQMPYSPWMSHRLVRKFARYIPIVATFHVAPVRLVSKVGTRSAALVMKRSTAALARVISVSPVAQQYCRQTYGISSTVCRPVLRPALGRPPDAGSNSDLTVSHVGQLSRRKDPVLLVEAVHLARKITGLDISLDIAGEGPLRSAVEARSRELGIEGAVRLHGYVSEAVKYDLLRRSRIAVFPSRGGESYGLVLAEALSTSTTVLAAANPGYQHVLGSVSGSLEPPADVGAFATKISSILTNETFEASLRYRQGDLWRRLAAHDAVAEVENVYRSAFKHRTVLGDSELTLVD